MPTAAARARGFATAVAALAGGAAVGVLGLAGAVRLLAGARLVGVEQAPAAPVALVLGAEVYADGRPSRFLRARLDLAAELYRLGRVERLLLSGDGASEFYDETAGMRAYLIAQGLPAAALLLDPAGFDTYRSCRRARDLFGLRRLLVVSQRYHLPRALVICRALGIEAWGVGDLSARENSRTWTHGVFREAAANLKVIADLVRHPRAGS